MKSNTSRWGSTFCLRQIVFCFSMCSVFLVLLLERPSWNDCASHQRDPHRAEWVAETQQLQRQNLLREKCRNTRTSPASESKRNVTTPVRFKIEDRHRIMYCEVPKVASTNLKRLMLILSGVVETDDLSSIPRPLVHRSNPMRTMDAYKLNDTLLGGTGNFTKFMFARHPFERLVSAYRDKLVGNNTNYRRMVGRGIIRRYRQNASRLSLQTGDDVTFPEFVTFIVDEWRNGERPLDPHWRPAVDHCLPCEMRFDFIGKFETLNQDVDYLLRTLGQSDLSRLLMGQPKAQTTPSLWKESMKTISYQQLRELNRIFADDFRLFGYPHYYTGEQRNQQLISSL